MWIPVDKFAEEHSISKQAVYKRIRNKRLKSKKEGGITLVYIKDAPKITQAEAVNTTVDKLYEVISMMEEAHKRELESKDKLIKIKDKRISELEIELKVLKDKGLFGGLFKG